MSYVTGGVSGAQTPLRPGSSTPGAPGRHRSVPIPIVNADRSRKDQIVQIDDLEERALQLAMEEGMRSELLCSPQLAKLSQQSTRNPSATIVHGAPMPG